MDVMVGPPEHVVAGGVGVGVGAAEGHPGRPWHIFLQLNFLLPATVLVLLVISAVFARLLAPYDPLQTVLTQRLQPPVFAGGTSAHLLGTDKLGRDVLSRIIFGSRVALSASILVILITSTIGTTLGILGGYLGGVLDSVLMRVTDISLAFPGILVALLLAVTMGPSFTTVVLAISLLGWAPYARLIRAEVLKLRTADFVLQARIMGCSARRIMITHIFPNVVNPLLILATLSVGLVILLESALSFLGAGIPPPTATWGSMVSDGRSLIDTAWWISFFPGLAIGLVVLAGNYLGDWLRDRLDPRLRQMQVDPLLQVEDLRTYFFTRRGVVKAVDGVSFSVAPGETLGIVGESGSGKTMTSLSLLRLVPQPGGKIVGGKVLFEGVDLLQLSEARMREYRGSKISMILQDPMASLNPVYTVGEQVAEPLRQHQHLSGKSLWEQVTEALRLLRIPSPRERLRNYPHQMSGGMRQRVVGGIAISCRPQLIIADEPTTALDATIQAQYLTHLKDLQRQTNVAMIFVSHDFGIVARMCDRVAVMYAGKIVETASVRELFSNPRHPYTVGLVHSVPRLDRKEARLASIDGQPPALLNLPPGCRFAPRCYAAFDRCRAEEPPSFQAGDAHVASCWKVA